MLIFQEKKVFKEHFLSVRILFLSGGNKSAYCWPVLGALRQSQMDARPLSKRFVKEGDCGGLDRNQGAAVRTNSGTSDHGFVRDGVDH